MSEELPEGWVSVTLDQLIPAGGIFDGPFGSSLKTADYTDSGVRVIRLENVANLRFVADKETWISKSKYEELLRHTVGEGDIIFGSFVDESCRVCLLPRLPTPAIAKADCFCLRPRDGVVDRKFLVYQLGSNETRNALVQEIHGATRPRINTGQLRALRVALPPIAEQRRIVARVEALLACVKAARDRLEKVPLLLKRFRRSVLAKAFRGELVPTEADLAARDGRTFQSAAELLGRQGGTETDEVPDGWVSTTVEQVLRPGGLFDGPFGSSLKTSDYTAAGVRVIRLENVANLRFVAEKETWISKTKYAELKRHSVGEGDIIFGSFVDDSCRVCILPALPTPAIAKADCFCLRPRDELVDRRFLVYQLGSAATRNALVEEIHGATRPRINTGQLRALNIVLPPIAEQRRIVAKVDALFAAAAIVEARTESLRAALGRAPQTILQRAFSGELVPTEADLAATEQREFESGNDLLKRASDSLAAVPRPRRTRTPAATG